MYKIREAKVEDFTRITAINDALDNIHIRTMPSLEKKDFVAVIAANDAKMYVVEKSGVIAAFILFYINEQERSILIDKFSLEKTFEKKGLDEHLYHKVEQLATRRGFQQMVTTIQVDNPNVYNFFERKGWKQESQNYYVLNVK